MRDTQSLLGSADGTTWLSFSLGGAESPWCRKTGEQRLKRNTQGTQAEEESLGAEAPGAKELAGAKALAGVNLLCVVTESLQRWLSRAGLKRRCGCVRLTTYTADSEFPKRTG